MTVANPLTQRKPRLLLVSANDFGQASVNLGAAAKVAALLRIFERLGFELHYLDSSHQVPGWQSATLGQQACIDGTVVKLWRPFKVPNRKLGKLLNVLLVDGFYRKLETLAPDLVWIYNSYAFEGAIAQRFFERMAVPFVMELEDLPLSRPRGLNPKPYWDQKYFNLLRPKAGLVTFVNQGLLDACQASVQRSLLLPSILHTAFSAAPDRSRFQDEVLTVGYFGGLTREKGAGLLLDCLPRLPPPWRLVATGAGELDAEFSAAAQRHPDRFTFHGAVATHELHALMRSCDVIVNPHHSIEAMRNGVFPFKVCEAIASGALLVSTALPSIGEDMASSVLFFDGSAEGLLGALDAAPAFNQRHGSSIDGLRQRVLAQYSELSLGGQLGQVLSQLLPAGTPGIQMGGPAAASPH